MSELKLRPIVRAAGLAFAATAVAFSLAGCGKASSHGSGGNTTQITAPKGTVIGSVVDNQGNPLAGVKVTIGNKTITTTAAGTYQFDNVAVNTTTASSSSNGSPTGQFFTVVLQPPAGYLGATVTANASSQCVAGCTQSPPSSGGEVFSGGGSSVTNPQTIFVDGYTASAGTTVLPALNATATGTLRNGNTGAIYAGVPLYAQLISVNAGSAQTSTNSSTVVNYATGVSTPIAGGQTGADGSFTLSNLAADACYAIYSNNFNVSFDANVETQSSDVSGGCDKEGSVPAAIQYVLLSTNNSPIGLNQIYALASPNADKTRPWVTSTDKVITSQPSISPALLDSTVTNTLVVHFSEKMVYTASTTNPLTVIIGTGANLTVATVTSATLDSTGTALTLVLANNLPTGATVKVNLPIESFTDTSGNLLADHSFAVSPYVAYDGLTSGNNTVIDQLTYNTFQPGNTDTGTFSVSQNFTAKNTTSAGYVFSNVLGDLIGTDTSTACSVTSNFVSTGCTTDTVSSGAAGLLAVNQLNGFEKSTPSYYTGGNLVQDELSSLLNVINGDSALFFGGDQSVNTNVARVSITLATPTQVADLALQVTDSLGNPKSVLFFPVNSTGGPNAPVAEGPVGLSISPTVTPTKAAANNSTSETPNIANPGEGWYGINPKGNASFDVVIVGQGSDVVKPGDLLHVVSRANLSGSYLVSQGQLLTLKDEVDPTTTLNILAKASGTANTSAQGQGGVIYTGPVPGAAGLVIFPVTPQLADTSDANESNGNYYVSNTFDQELFQTSGMKAAGATDALLPEGANLRADTDATGVNAFLNAATGGAKNVPTALAVSESVTVTGTPAYNGASATLSAFGAASNVQSKGYGPAGIGPFRYNDLVSFTVSDIFKLAADGRNNSVIDLTGAITDPSGNVAAAGDNAKALVQDFFPPVMVAGYTNGTNYVFTFNEPIQLYGQITFDSNGPCVGGTADLHALATLPTPQASLDATGTVLTIAQSAATSCFFASGNTNYTYAEPYYTTANTGVANIPAKLQHAFVSFQNVPDSVGNVWVSGSGAANEVSPSWSARGLGMGSPHFAIVNLVGPLTVTTSISNFVVNTNPTTFTASVNANQPLVNLLQPSVAAVPGPVATPTESAIFSTSVTVAATGFGANPCAGKDMNDATCAAFINNNVVITGACATPTPTGSTATTTATGISYTINCPSIAAGNTVTLKSDTNVFESQIVDPNTGNNLIFTLGTGTAPSTLGSGGA